LGFRLRGVLVVHELENQLVYCGPAQIQPLERTTIALRYAAQ